MAVLRDGNHFFVKNDVKTTGKADSELYYGDAGDNFLVGDWNGDGKDTLTVSRADTSFHVSNTLEGGKAEYSFFYGNPGDTVLVGDWANPAKGESGNGADQLAVRRDGNHYFLSAELGKDANVGKAMRDFRYGEATDTVFTAALPTPQLNADGTQKIDEIRAETYAADEAAKYKAGEVMWTVTVGGTAASPTYTYSQAKDSFGRTVTATGGEAKAQLPDVQQYYRGGEPVIGWNGVQEKWTQAEIDAKKNVKHVATDFRLAADGSVIRFSPSATGTGVVPGAPLMWDDADTTQQVASFDLTATASGGVNYLNVKAGDPKVHRAGEPVLHSIDEQETWLATDPVQISAGTDYDLDANGKPQADGCHHLRHEVRCLGGKGWWNDDGRRERGDPQGWRAQGRPSGSGCVGLHLQLDHRNLQLQRCHHR
jgi:hypothetical protein